MFGSVVKRLKGLSCSSQTTYFKLTLPVGSAWSIYISMFASGCGCKIEIRKVDKTLFLPSASKVFLVDFLSRFHWKNLTSDHRKQF